MFNKEVLWRAFDRFVGVDGEYKARVILLQLYGVEQHLTLSNTVSQAKEQIRLWNQPQNINKQGRKKAIRDWSAAKEEAEEALKKYDPQYAAISLREILDKQVTGVMDGFNKILREVKADHKYQNNKTLQDLQEVTLQGLKVIVQQECDQNDNPGYTLVEAFSKTLRKLQLVVNVDKTGDNNVTVRVNNSKDEVTTALQGLEKKLEAMQLLEDAMNNRLAYNFWDYSQIAMVGGHLMFALYKAYQDGWQKTVVSCAIAGLEICYMQCFNKAPKDVKLGLICLRECLRNIGFTYTGYSGSELYWFLNLRANTFFGEAHAMSYMCNSVLNGFVTPWCVAEIVDDEIVKAKSEIEYWSKSGDSVQVLLWNRELFNMTVLKLSMQIMSALFGCVGSEWCNTKIDYAVTWMCGGDLQKSKFADQFKEMRPVSEGVGPQSVQLLQ